MLSTQQQLAKRCFDLLFSITGLVLLGWVIGITALLAKWSTGSTGIFSQKRVGRNGKLFTLWKIRTMSDVPGVTTHVTTANDVRVTPLGRWLRRTKLDELPQLINVLRGEMSFVGPRPDVPEIAQRLMQEAPEILSIQPGITGPASLRYRDEEEILAQQSNPDWFNRNIIYSDKIKINRVYIRNYSFWRDLQFIWLTLSGLGDRANPAEFRTCNQHEQLAA